MDRMPVQRMSDANERVRRSACSSSATGLRDRFASSHAIEVGCDGCAARQSSANCSPRVPPRYSTSALLCASSRSNWSLCRAPSALILDSVAGRHFSRFTRLRSSSTDCLTETPYALHPASCSSAVYLTLWFTALSRSSRATKGPVCFVASARCLQAHSRNRASSHAAPGSVQPAKSAALAWARVPFGVETWSLCAGVRDGSREELGAHVPRHVWNPQRQRGGCCPSSPTASVSTCSLCKSLPGSRPRLGSASRCTVVTDANCPWPSRLSSASCRSATRWCPLTAGGARTGARSQRSTHHRSRRRPCARRYRASLLARLLVRPPSSLARPPARPLAGATLEARDIWRSCGARAHFPTSPFYFNDARFPCCGLASAARARESAAGMSVSPPPAHAAMFRWLVVDTDADISGTLRREARALLVVLLFADRWRKADLARRDRWSSSRLPTPPVPDDGAQVHDRVVMTSSPSTYSVGGTFKSRGGVLASTRQPGTPSIEGRGKNVVPHHMLHDEVAVRDDGRDYLDEHPVQHRAARPSSTLLVMSFAQQL
jgi:hypothetical protein